MTSGVTLTPTSHSTATRLGSVLALSFGCLLCIVAHAPAGKVYWALAGARVDIYRANLDGSDVEEVILRSAHLHEVQDVALDLAAGKLYWTEAVWLPEAIDPVGRIMRSDLDGGNVEPLVETSFDDPVGLAIHPQTNSLFWTLDVFDAQQVRRIRHAAQDGQNQQDLAIPDFEDALFLAIHSATGRLYWSNFVAGTIQRTNFDYSSLETIVGPSDLTPISLTIDSLRRSHLYWTWFREGGLLGPKHGIIRSNLDGTDPQPIVHSIDLLHDIDVDSDHGKIYWTASGLGQRYGKVQRANLDGSDVEDVTITGAFVTGLAVDPRDFGDLDGNGAVDLRDFAHFQTCFSSTINTSLPGACSFFNTATADRTISDSDFQAFHAAFVAP